jgi:acetyltransferase-like isoleucine patch superfamily enzyme
MKLTGRWSLQKSKEKQLILWAPLTPKLPGMKQLVKLIFECILFVERMLRIEAIKKLYRYYKLKKQLKNCGQGVDFQFPIVIKNAEFVEIGNGVVINSFVHVWGGGGLKIGNRVLIGSHTALVTETHDYIAKNMYHSLIKAPILIEDEVWLGAHVIVFPGVTIGRGAVIGAGSVVNKNVSPGEIVAGVPARTIKYRNFVSDTSFQATQES